MIWLGLGGCQILAQSKPHFTVDVWGPNTRVHPPQSSIIAMTQTRDGYLWVGTRDGLARFDGVQFTFYNEGNTPGLKSSPIIKLFQDSHANLWIGTETAGIFLVTNGQVRNLAIGHSPREDRLMSICQDRTGAVWLGLADYQIARYRDGRVATWRLGRVRSLICDESGLLWVGNDFGLSGWQPPADDKNDEPPKPVAGSAIPLPGLDFLLARKQGGLWCLSNGRILKFKSGRFEEVGTYHWNREKTPVTCGCEDLKGNLIVGTAGEGVFWFDAKGDYVQLSSGTLSHNWIFSLCMDSEGDLWVGTDGGGLNRVKEQVFDVVEVTRDATVQTVSEDGHGGLWIGYNGERVDHWDADGNQEFKNSQGLFNIAVRSIVVDADQKVWVGTIGGRGLLQLQNGLFLQPPGAEFLGRDIEIPALFLDHDKNLWAGRQSGLARWNGSEWTVTNLPSPYLVRCIAEDQQGGLWAGTDGGGLVHLIGNRTPEALGKTNGLPSDNVNCLYADKSGVLWIGTAGGLARLNSGKIFSFAGHPELAGGIGYLLEDAQGYLWLGTANGLRRARKHELDELASGTVDSVLVRSYGRSAGLPTGECSQGSQPSACRTQNGRLWFPTTLGLAVVDPTRLSPNTNAPAVLIESVLIDGQSQGSNTLQAPVPQSVTIPADKESLEIRYTSLNLSAPEEGRFKYRLQGHETAWTSRLGTVRYARYSKLPHGHYRFQVIACNEDGVWNDIGASLGVTVLPPFWQTSWFIGTVALVLLGAIVGTVHFVSTQKLQKQLAALRQQEMLEKERARIARDLHDQLGANLTQVALLGELAETDKGMPDQVEEHARQISQTARETTRALDEIVWTVNPSNDTLDGLINYVCKYAQEYLALAGLRYRLEVPPQLPATPIAPELRHNVFLVAKEAINNIVKHSKASSVWLRLTLDTNRFLLEIEDDGRGLVAADEQKGRSGLRNMRKRMEEIGGEFLIAPRPEGGTRVRLSVPLTSRTDLGS
jgi:signal transduction histidine kinase/ligand-binding sensor domain-containing protein